MNKRIPLVFAVLALFLITLPASAAEVASGESYRLPQSQTINENLYVGAGMATISGVVEGDLVVGGGNITIDGTITGDVLAGGGTVEIFGTVGGDVRAGGGTLIISGPIAGDILLGGGNIRILSNSTVGGDAILGGGLTAISGSVAGKFLGGGGNTTIDGSILGDVEIQSDEVIVTEGATIGGNLKYSAPREAKIDDGATISGEVMFTERIIPPLDKGALAEKESFKLFVRGVVATFAIMKTLAMIILALILLWLFPRFSRMVVEEGIKNWGKALVTGFVLLVVIPIAALILALTLFGGMVAWLLMLVYFLIVMLAIAYGGVIFGAFAWQKIKKLKEPPLNWKIVTLGILSAAILRFIPFIGWIFAMLIFLVALGALGQLLYRDPWLKR